MKGCWCLMGILGGLVAQTAVAQAPASKPTVTPPAITPAAPRPTLPVFDETTQKRINQNRIDQFEPRFAEVYKITDAQRPKLKELLGKIADEDLKYNKDNIDARNKAHEDLRNAQTELMKAYQTQPRNDEEIKKIQAKQAGASEAYRNFQNKAPWDPTLTRIADRIDKDLGLPADQVKAGRAEFDRRKPYGLMPPPTNPPNQPQLTPQPVPQGPEQIRPSLYRTVNGAAPATTEWENKAKAVAKDRKFSDEQNKKLDVIIKQIMGRVEAAKKAEAPKDPKMAKPIDLLYDELMQRVDNISRADQMPASSQPMAPAPMGGGH